MASAGRRRRGGDGVWPGLRPASGTAHVAWFTEGMAGREGVALVVPEGFEAYARIVHPREDGRRWREVEPSALEVGPDATWGPDNWTGLDGVSNGDLPPALVDDLLPLLVPATSTPELAHYGLWVGWGELNRGASTRIYSPAPTRGIGRFRHERAVRRAQRRWLEAKEPVHDLVASCPVAPWWGGRDMLLLDGPVEAVRSLRPDPGDDALFGRRSPQWWWPDDRAWFVATEIDDSWSYVAGTTALIDAVIADGRWESVRVSRTDPW